MAPAGFMARSVLSLSSHAACMPTKLKWTRRTSLYKSEMKFQSATTIVLLCLLSFTSILLVQSLFYVLNSGGVVVHSQDVSYSNHYTYEWDDFPSSLPGQFQKNASMVVEESVHYSISDPEAGDEWIYNSPYGAGSYRMGENNRMFFLSMFHELHCLRQFRSLLAKPNKHADFGHAQHCLNYLRETILCEADTTLESGDFTKRNFTNERFGETHICRDWGVIYETLRLNWFGWFHHMKTNNFSITDLRAAASLQGKVAVK